MTAADSVLEAALSRDRRIVAGALAALTALAWAYTLWLAHTMPMPAGEMGAAMTAKLHSWSAVEFGYIFVMWAVMMVGMMVPSAAPMILIYARVGRRAACRGTPLAATGYFAGGYLLAWTVFSLAATIGQWALERGLLLTPMMASSTSIFSGLVLLVAGLFQWTPFKHACLRHCQAPLVFLQRHGGFRRDPQGSLAMGFHHGLYCVGCCWALMALLFVGGVMNPLCIAGIAIFVLAEKLLPAGRWFSRAAGSALGIGGLWLLFSSWP